MLIEYTTEGDIVNQDVKKYKIANSVEDALSWINTNKPKLPNLYKGIKLEIQEQTITEHQPSLMQPILVFPKEWKLKE